MKKKKIGLILPTSPRNGGEHQYAVFVVTCLLERAGIDYELIALCGNRFWEKWCKNAQIRYVGCPFPESSECKIRLTSMFPKLAAIYDRYMTPLGKAIEKEQIDLLFSTQQGVFVPEFGVKFIVPVHDLMHRYEPHFPEVRSALPRRELYMKYLARHADCILVDSKLGRRQYKESYFHKFSRKPHVVSLPYVVPEYIYTTEEEFIEVPPKYIFYPAQFWKHKNHMNLIKAIRILQTELEDIHLVLVGSEKNNYREVKRAIRDNGLEHYVTTLGFVSDGKMVYLYKHAVGMVMPTYFGPTNLPPLEAMALGCPVAVSNNYAMPEQIGRAGLLFDPDSPEEIADCIKKLWTDDQLCENLTELGYKRVQRWSKEKFSRRLYQTIHAVLSEQAAKEQG
ncbi:N-acetylgalactosamine-N,N'-diacetylbacillosaminyl-diphospho-undecaprenol 4-alpha-N-acetylgalactosaminyltransferase [Lachnospiraceae bacterium]|nr:N-acetylgalactosamine-N,N'-diacetylbacillosaminyl-diphospho-undecaprenol 4-alpha-N-acetylgalactosaminyltransferase [Lachnospiraceae bacterium]